MFKFVVLSLIAVWIASLLFDRKRSLIRDANHLLMLLAWTILAFSGLTLVSKSDYLQDNGWIKFLVVLAWFAMSYGIVKLVFHVVYNRRSGR